MSGELVAALLGAALGGIIALASSLLIYNRQDRALESNGIRSKRIDLIVDLVSSRYALSSPYSDQDRVNFNRSISAIPALFSEMKEVMKIYDIFINDQQDTDKLLRLIEACAAAVDIAISDTHLRRTATLPLPLQQEN